MIVDLLTPPDIADFVVAYEGPALVEHTIPVRDLAPSLLALGQTLERVNTLVNGASAAASLEIRATSVGSFEIDLALRQILDGAGLFFTGVGVTSAANITQLVLGAPAIGLSLIGFMKRLHGRQAVEVSRVANAVSFEVDHMRIVVPSEVALAYHDRTVRQNIEAMVRPLANDGIDRMAFRTADTELESIEKVDLASFRESASSTGITTQTIIPKQQLQIASLNFQNGQGQNKGKWKLTDGLTPRWYTIRDEIFIERVRNGTERFGSKDILVCEVLQLQSIDAKGTLKMECEITRVIAHETPSDQATLFDTLDDSAR